MCFLYIKTKYYNHIYYVLVFYIIIYLIIDIIRVIFSNNYYGVAIISMMFLKAMSSPPSSSDTTNPTVPNGHLDSTELVVLSLLAVSLLSPLSPPCITHSKHLQESKNSF